MTVLADAVRLGDVGERVCAGDRKCEVSRLDQLSDLGEHMDRAAVVPTAEHDPVAPRAGEVRDRHDVGGAAGELDEFGQYATPRDIEREIDAVGRERANPLHEPLAIGDGLGAKERR